MKALLFTGVEIVAEYARLSLLCGSYGFEFFFVGGDFVDVVAYFLVLVFDVHDEPA